MALPKEIIYPGYDSSGLSLFYNRAESYPGSRLEMQRHAALRLGQARDLKLIQVPHNTLYQPLFGLEEYIRLKNAEVPTYIFDGHNHAFFGWTEGYQEGEIASSSSLIHIDDHPDNIRTAIHLPQIDILSLEQAAETAKRLEIYEFICPSLEIGLVNTVYWVRKGFGAANCFSQNGECPYIEIGSESILELLSTLSPDRQKTIVDVDIDYFSQITNKAEEIEEIEKIKGIMKFAGIVTIAISPGYISPFRALGLVKVLLG